MKVLVVTVAGMASRFEKSLGYPCLKCLYRGEGQEESVLGRLLHMHDFDKYILVGGYRFDELKGKVADEFRAIGDKIMLVENEKYAEYGSGYSLYLGLSEAVGLDFSEVVFAEGDLLVDRKSFEKVCGTPADVLTINAEPVRADTAVACYLDLRGRAHYIYDTGHRSLEIREPFTAIYNSGQVWKFFQPELLRKIFYSLKKEEWTGTNLAFIQAYLEQCRGIEIIPFEKWVNCNTVQDYERGMAEIV